MHFVFYFPALLQHVLFGHLDLGNLLEANFGLQCSPFAAMNVLLGKKITLVSSGVLGKDWRLSGLCAWSPALKILPASSVHMQL